MTPSEIKKNAVRTLRNTNGVGKLVSITYIAASGQRWTDYNPTGTNTALTTPEVINPPVGTVLPITSQGDLIKGGATGQPTRFGRGEPGQLLATGDIDLLWIDPPTPSGANPIISRGDLVVGGVAGNPTRLPLGAEGTVITSRAGDAVWAPVPAQAAPTLPLTTKGDLLVANDLGLAARLPVGTDGKLLGAVAGAPAWVDAPTAVNNQPLYPYTARAAAQTVTPTVDTSGRVTAVVWDFGAVGTLTDRAVNDARYSMGVPLLVTRQNSQTVFNGLSLLQIQDNNLAGVDVDSVVPAIYQQINDNGQTTSVRRYYGEGVTQDTLFSYLSPTAQTPTAITKQPKVRPTQSYGVTYSSLSPARGGTISMVLALPAGLPAYTITPVATNGEATFTPATLSVTAGQTSAVISCASAASADIGVVFTNTGNLGDPLPQIVTFRNAVEYADAYGVSFSPALAPGVTSTVTFTANKGGWPNGTILTPRVLSGAATLSTATVNTVQGQMTATATIAVSAAGRIVLSYNNNRNLVNPVDQTMDIARPITWSTLSAGASLNGQNQVVLQPTGAATAISGAIDASDPNFGFVVGSATPYNSAPYSVEFTRNAGAPFSRTTNIEAEVIIGYALQVQVADVLDANGVRGGKAQVFNGQAFDIVCRRSGNDLVLSRLVAGVSYTYHTFTGIFAGANTAWYLRVKGIGTTNSNGDTNGISPTTTKVELI